MLLLTFFLHCMFDVRSNPNEKIKNSPKIQSPKIQSPKSKSQKPLKSTMSEKPNEVQLNLEKPVVQKS